MSAYKDALTAAMTKLGEHPQTLFVGQTMQYGGQTMFPTFAGVPMWKRIELPVAEEFQMGYCIGLALEGYIPISVYARWDFLILAANQLVNHLDKLPLMGKFRPKVIIRTGVGPKEPLNAGPQHTQDHSVALRWMLRTIPVWEIRSPGDAVSMYEEALKYDRSVLVVENLGYYRDRPVGRESEIMGRVVENDDGRRATAGT